MWRRRTVETLAVLALVGLIVLAIWGTVEGAKIMRGLP